MAVANGVIETERPSGAAAVGPARPHLDLLVRHQRGVGRLRGLRPEAGRAHRRRRLGGVRDGGAGTPRRDGRHRGRAHDRRGQRLHDVPLRAAQGLHHHRHDLRPDLHRGSGPDRADGTPGLGRRGTRLDRPAGALCRAVARPAVQLELRPGALPGVRARSGGRTTGRHRQRAGGRHAHRGSGGGLRGHGRRGGHESVGAGVPARRGHRVHVGRAHLHLRSQRTGGHAA